MSACPSALPPLLLLALAACGPPADADIAPSDYVLAAENPTLLPDSDFSAAVAEARPAGVRLEAEAALLAARAEALRARVEGMGTLIDPAARERLEAAERPAGG